MATTANGGITYNNPGYTDEVLSEVGPATEELAQKITAVRVGLYELQKKHGGTNPSTTNALGRVDFLLDMAAAYLPVFAQVLAMAGTKAVAAAVGAAVDDIKGKQ